MLVLLVLVQPLPALGPLAAPGIWPPSLPLPAPAIVAVALPSGLGQLSCRLELLSYLPLHHLLHLLCTGAWPLPLAQLLPSLQCQPPAPPAVRAVRPLAWGSDSPDPERRSCKHTLRHAATLPQVQVSLLLHPHGMHLLVQVSKLLLLLLIALPLVVLAAREQLPLLCQIFLLLRCLVAPALQLSPHLLQFDLLTLRQSAPACTG